MLARVKPVLNRQPRGFSITVIYWVLYSVIFTVTGPRPGASLMLTETYRAVLDRSRYLALDEGSCVQPQYFFSCPGGTPP